MDGNGARKDLHPLHFNIDEAREILQDLRGYATWQSNVLISTGWTKMGDKELFLDHQMPTNPSLNTSQDEMDGHFTKYISDEVFTVIIILIATAMGGIISALGVVTNIINIIVFVRQGVFSDSSTVSLLGLGVADFLSAGSMLWMGITYCVARFEPPGLNWEPYDIMYMTGTWPHVISGLITRVVTALIAFERCFCVVFPFKVKNVFTPKCSFASIISIFAYFFLVYTPVYIMNTFHLVKHPEMNQTRLILVEHPKWQLAQVILSYSNLYTLNFCAVIIVLICTTITTSRVKLSSAWRESIGPDTTSTKSNNEIIDTEPKRNSKQVINENNGNPQKLTGSKLQKEKKLIKMITLISMLFLICYLPSIATPVIYSYDREIRTDGKYRNLAWTIWSIVWCSETLNSSINIFIYHRMSTKFRKEFNVLFGITEN